MRRLRRTPALRRLVAETRLVGRRPGRAAVRAGGDRRAGADRLDARRTSSTPCASLARRGQAPGRPRRARRSCCSGSRRPRTPTGSGAQRPRRDRPGRARPSCAAALGDELVLIADLCLDEYTDHGHCGVLDADGTVDNDATLERYARSALAQAAAGRRRGRAERDDGRPGRRRSAPRSTATGTSETGDPRLRGQVRLGALRARSATRST